MTKKKPIIFAIDDDPQVLKSIKADLRYKYRKDFRIMAASSAQEALEALPQIKNKGEDVALFLSDQRMPSMNGVEFLKQAKRLFPLAKRALLTAYSEVDAAIAAINEVQLDYYLSKPWNPPEEKLFPITDELLDEYQAQRRLLFRGMRVIAYPNNPETHKIKEFLSGNLIPYRFMDASGSDLETNQLIEINALDSNDFPVVILESGEILKKASIHDIAGKVGLSTAAQFELYDVVIVGAGPAGLAAAVYGGSEGLKTAVIEKMAPGGQAGTSSRIENYLGFPNGISGSELSRRALAQAKKFGVEFISPAEIEQLEIEGDYKILHLKDGKKIRTKAVVLSTGMTYRKHPARGMDERTGASVYYGAATTEASALEDKKVFIVGGGNSAGQGAVYLSNFASSVCILIRKPDLSSSMSQYLIDQIDQIDNIEVRGNTEITEVGEGSDCNELYLLNNQSNKSYREECDAVFVFIGTRPNTGWIEDLLLRDRKGFILTGKDVANHPEYVKRWSYTREPMSLEASIPGVFAVGDVRAGAMNRVASAVGEGSMSIKMTHEYLAQF